MDIVHIASEFAPIAKVGGLGDVTSALARAVAKQEHSVTVVLPRYDMIDLPVEEHGTLSIAEEEIAIPVQLWLGEFEGVKIILVDPSHPKKYFSRGQVYGEADDIERFLFFSKAAVVYLESLEKVPDIIHLHDWPSAGVSLIAKDRLPSRQIFTIHNLAHQGLCNVDNLDALEIPYVEAQIVDPVYPDALNLVKGAIIMSDVVTAVSPTYAKEIQTPKGGHELDKTIAENKRKLKGILNGLDVDYWNPETDTHLKMQYNVSTCVEGKKANKRAVQKEVGLEERDAPLVVSVTRLVEQKGPDLIAYGIEKVAALGGQFVLLGSVSTPEIEEQFVEIRAVAAENPNITILLDYDEPLSHRLFAASDLFFMPSIFEPCGLTQMIALRYGSLPLVRATGGLIDTVFDPKKSKEPNGFSFSVPDNSAVNQTFERAFTTLHENPELWQAMQRRGMETDFSWEKSAKKYLKIYE